MATSQSIPVNNGRPPLPLEIHAATRTYHTSLNRLIISRLPLCLPPHAPDVATYVNGIGLFGQIYFAFERYWDEQLETLQKDQPQYVLLKRLRLASLSRSGRLQNDLDLLRSTLGEGVLLDAPSADGDSAWREGIKRSIQKKPHVVLAYAWVMYMALFNGGRWMRDQLTNAGDKFWDSCPNSAAVVHSGECIPCLSFWEFEGDGDGNDIKDDFKARFISISELLGDAERQDVVEEAVYVFKMCSEMVGWLDTQIPTPASSSLTANSWDSVILATASSAAHSLWIGLSRIASAISLRKPTSSSLVNEGVHVS